ncbi:glycosyltransferase family 2 protein [Rubellimicrobium aerolatum]|uniref:Glycosyltransferase family 2 protein n=1 Tax=Rubellimicrobium aerolatum TaxID=490979 RepID=A0ABW0SC43_9RHOB|nr:glycosyltransferase family A protein [Rubellimicrobium aerolatum]MBP1805951.1 glycosyltransferase involved in cell wall biosynthesis [Rubellimicrobium aerolatum]
MTVALDVLLPHHRDPEGLARSLASVAAQTWAGPVRAVVLDDGSPPADLARVEALAERVRAEGRLGLLLLRNPVNEGRPRSRNRLLDAAEAPRLAWLDAGDEWYPDKIARQSARLEELLAQGRDPARTWITCGYDMAQGARVQACRQEVGGDQHRALLLGRSLRAYLWTILAPREAFRLAGRFDERLTRLQDLDLFLSFVRAGGRIEAPEDHRPLCRYAKSHRGRSAEEIRACQRIVLARHAADAADLLPELDYRADRLAARVARANGRRLAAARYLAGAALRHPRLASRAALARLGLRPEPAP